MPLTNRREADIQRSNDALVNARLAALEQTFTIKKGRLEGYLRSAIDPKIRRMRSAQLRNIESKYQSQVAKTKEQQKMSVSFSLELAEITRIEYAPRPAAVKEKLAPEVAEPVLTLPEFLPEPIPTPARVKPPEPVPAIKVERPRAESVKPARVAEKPTPEKPKEPVQITVKPVKLEKPAEPVKQTTYQDEFSIKPEQIRVLQCKQGGLLAFLFEGRKSLLESIMEKTGAEIRVDAARNRLYIKANSQAALAETIRLIRERLYLHTQRRK